MKIQLLMTVFAVACASGPVASDAESIRPGEPFRVRAGDEARWPGEDLTVRFVAVVGDSRCPRDVTCFWEGDAEIEVLLTRGDEKATLELHTNLGERYPQQGTALGFTLRLESLDPYPQYAEPIAKQDYVANLVVLTKDESAEDV